MGKVIIYVFTISLIIITSVCNAKKKVQLSLKQSDPATKVLQDNWQLLRQRQLRLLPVPKQIQFKGEPVDLLGKVAIIIRPKTEQDRIAISEINSRVMELTGKPLPIFSVPKKDFFNIIIDNRQANFFTKEQVDSVKTVNPYCRRQAYGLEVIPGGIKLAGNSPLGMMYAAVTLRYLIEKSDGKTFLYPADIVDWPDFPRRLVADFSAPYHRQYSNNPEKHLKNMAKFINWAFRLKSNMVWRHTFTPRSGSQSPFSKEPMAAAKVMTAGKLVGAYLKARGMSSLASSDVALGYRTDAGNPAVKGMLLDPAHKKYFSWARHDLHRKKAEKISKTFSQGGYTDLFVHAVDGGGFRDPELWSKRDQLTRKKYGNNRVKADLDMFKIYIDAFRARNLDPTIIIYPYSGLFLQDKYAFKALGLAPTAGNKKLVEQKLNKIKQFMKAINAQLPKDIKICVRESKKEIMDDYYQVYAGRPMLIYFEVMHPRYSIGQLLPKDISSFWSAYDPSRKQNDIIWLQMYRKFMEQAAVGGAEYAWNAKFPGYSDLDRANSINYNAATLAVMAERAAVGLWGDKYGQLLKDVFSHNLSLYLAYAPEAVLNGLRTNSEVKPLEILKNNFIAAKKAVTAMDIVWRDLKLNKSSMDSFSYPIFITYYEMIKAAAVYAGGHYYSQLAYDAAAKGDLDAAVQAVAAGRIYLDTASGAYRQTILELKLEPRLVKYSQLSKWWHSVPANSDTNLLKPDFSMLTKKLDQVLRDRIKIFERHNVTADFKKSLSKKLLAVKRSDEIIIDGDLSERSWKKISPLERFVNIKMLSVPVNPVFLKIAYDKNNIYFAGKIEQPLLTKIKTRKHSRKEYVYTESIEIYLQPKGNGVVYQFVIDSAGGLFTSKKDGLRDSENGIALGTNLVVLRQGDKWSFELAVPFSRIGQPNLDWKILIGFNSIERFAAAKPQVATFASVNLKGKNFSATNYYQQLKFVNKASFVLPKVKLSIRNAKAEERVHATGGGTLVSFGLTLESSRPLYDLKVKAVFLGKNRNPIGAPLLLLKKKFMPLTWKSLMPFSRQLSTTHKGIILEIVAEYKTQGGKYAKVTKTTLIGDVSFILSGSSSFIKGKSSGEKAFSGSFYIDTNFADKTLFSANKGAIGFEVKPDIAVYDRQAGRNDNETLLHCGMIRPKHPLLANRNAMTIKLYRRYGDIYFAVANENHNRISVKARVRDWKKGQWKRLYFIWDFTRKPIIMQIYIDGKLKSGKIVDKHQKPVTAFAATPLQYSIQWGAMNSGYTDFKGAINQLFITLKPKLYESWSKQNGLLFDFSGNLAGFSQTDKISGQDGIMPIIK